MQVNTMYCNGSCACRFPKIKEEGWLLVLGNPDTDELIALKRLSVSGSNKTVAKLVFPSELVSTAAHGLTLHLVSDSYLGLDQKIQV
jgi:hypothetical protein